MHVILVSLFVLVSKENEAILYKRYYCSWEGYSQENATNGSDESKKDTDTDGNQM
jgi:hypothetical protein